MANEQTSVPLYAALEVLTAANMNISAGTGVPVFATTVTRDAAFGGANEKTLAEGQLCYLSASNVVQYYDGAAWATVGPASASGLTLISTTTIGTTVSSVTVSSAFSSTYDNYKIIVSGGAGSTAVYFGLQFGSTTTGYYAGITQVTYSSSATASFSDSNASSFGGVGYGNTNGLVASIDVNSPNLAKNTFVSSQHARNATAAQSVVYNGFLNDTTQYTAFTITPGSGTLTGGTIKVYGYANS
jgi:hypothetical protein